MAGPLNPEMKIAHLSDFHLRHHLSGTSLVTARLSRRVPDLLSAAVEQIQSESPDLLAITGDLLDYPFYGMADADTMSLGRKDLGLIQEMLKPLTCPVAILYGNHDHPAIFQEAFGHLPLDFEVAGHRVLLFFDDEVDNHFPQRMGSERERFLSVISDNDPHPQIHLQHYLISPMHNEGYPHSYLEGDSLKASLTSDPRVRLVLSGHYHRGEDLFKEGSVHFATSKAFCEPPHPFRFYTLGEETIEQIEQTLPLSGELRPAVFLDRDGTIGLQPSYRTGPGDFNLIPGVSEALTQLKNAGYALVVVSNQTAVGQGFVTVETVGEVNDRMCALLDVELDGIYSSYGSRNAVVPALRSENPGTKPDPAMLLEAADQLGLDLSASFIVGDRPGDLEAGERAGCQATILVRTGDGDKTLEKLENAHPHIVVEDLRGAADWILSKDRQQ